MAKEPIGNRVQHRPGEVLLQAGLAKDAIPFLLKDLKAEPTEWKHPLNLAIAYKLVGQYEEAYPLLAKAMKMAPKAWPVYHALANLCDEDGKFDLAFISRQEAYKLCDGKSEDAALGMSVALLRRGQWKEAWRLWDDGRFMRSWSPIPGSQIAKMKELDGKRVFVLSEGGYGDVFMYCRWMPMLKERSGSVTLGAWPRQIDLLKCSSQLEGITIMPISDDIKPKDYDLTSSLMSLPSLLDATPETVPPPMTFDVEPLLPPRNGHRRLGICWKAEESIASRPLRSIPAQRMEVFSTIDAEWYSLVLNQKLPWMQPSPDNWLDTARLVKSLDGVVTVDTAVTHLSGSLGKPTTLLLPVCAEWKWMDDSTAKPWYEDMKLCRAKKHDDWTAAIEEAVRLYE